MGNAAPRLGKTYALGPAFDCPIVIRNSLRGIISFGLSGTVGFFSAAILCGRERLRPFGAVAINGQRLESLFPAGHISGFDLVGSGLMGHINRLADRAGDKRLNGGHHLDMCQIMDTAFALGGLKSAIKDSEMFRFKFLGGFDSVVFFDTINNRPNLVRVVAQLFQSHFNGIVHNLEHTAAGK